jgi:WD40 repeat protein
MHLARVVKLVCICLSLAPLTFAAVDSARLSDVREVSQANFNQDASRVVLRTGSGEVALWDTKKGMPITGDPALKKPAEAYVMSPDGRKVLVGFKDGHSRIFDATSGAAVSPVLDLSLRETENPQAVFSPDGGTIVFFGEKDTSVLEVKTGKRIATIPIPFEVEEGSGSAAAAIFISSGAKCFISDSVAKVTAYETKKWTALGKPMSHPPAEKAYTFGFDASSDGKWVVTFDDPGENGPKGQLQVWDALTSKPLGDPLSGENGMSGRFLRGQDRVLVQSGRGEATVRDLPSMNIAYVIKKDDELDRPKVDLFPNGKWLLGWGYDKKIDLIDAATGKVLNTYSSPVAITGVTIPPDSSAYYLGLDNSTPSTEDKYDNALQRFSVPDLKVTGSIPVAEYLLRHSLSPDGRWIMILLGATDNERIAIFDAATLKPIEWPKP